MQRECDFCTYMGGIYWKHQRCRYIGDYIMDTEDGWWNLSTEEYIEDCPHFILKGMREGPIYR